MGSLVMHLCVANKLKDKYQFSDKFVIGVLMPDLLKFAGKDKDLTHYLEDVIEESGVKRLPNVLKYEQDNEENLQDEKTLGYISHLIQDKVWFDKYIGKYAKTDANDTDKVKYLEYNITKTGEEFAKDMYNDYDNINKYLIKKYDLKLDSLKNALKNIAPDENFINRIDRCLVVNDIDFTSNNTFITKEDLDTYINEAIKKSSIEINKILGK